MIESPLQVCVRSFDEESLGRRCPSTAWLERQRRLFDRSIVSFALYVRPDPLR